MRSCEFCGAENLDAAKHCVACNEPMTAEAAAEDTKTIEAQHHKQFVRTELVVGAVAVALVGGLVYAGVRYQKHKAVQEEVRHYYKALLDADDGHVPPFWKCITRSDKVPKDNLELEQGLDVAINKSNGGYTKFAKQRCVPLINNAPTSLIGINPPVQVAASHEKYLAALKQLKTDVDAWIDAIDNVEKYKEDDERVARMAANYHYAEAESADTWAYDKFLRCVVPKMAEVKDEQGVLEALAPAMTDPITHLTQWRKDCYPILKNTAGLTADPDYKAKVEALSKDDRDVQAWKDIFKADAEKERKAAESPFEKAWYTFTTARSDHMAVIGGYLAD